MEAASRAEFEPLTPDPIEPDGDPFASPIPPRSPLSREMPGSALLEDVGSAPRDPAETAPREGAASPPSEGTSRAPREGTGSNTVQRAGSAPSEGAGVRPPSARAPAAQPVPPVMDRDFIARNQIVERYLSGKLPIKGATEFERFCSSHPEILDEIGLPERVNAALRLLEAGGKPEPWQESPKRFWEKPYLAIALGTAALVLLVATAILARSNSRKTVRIAELSQQVAAQPLDPATSTRTIRLLPSREGASSAPAVVVGGGQAQLAELLIDMSRSPYREFRVTIDRIDQGRVAIINNLTKDSNGHLRMAFNSSALGPGSYQFTIEGLTWRGEPEPDSWVTIGIQH